MISILVQLYTIIMKLLVFLIFFLIVIKNGTGQICPFCSTSENCNHQNMTVMWCNWTNSRLPFQFDKIIGEADTGKYGCLELEFITEGFAMCLICSNMDNCQEIPMTCEGGFYEELTSKIGPLLKQGCLDLEYESIDGQSMQIRNCLKLANVNDFCKMLRKGIVISKCTFRVLSDNAVKLPPEPHPNHISTSTPIPSEGPTSHQTTHIPLTKTTTPETSSSQTTSSDIRTTTSSQSSQSSTITRETSLQQTTSRPQVTTASSKTSAQQTSTSTSSIKPETSFAPQYFNLSFVLYCSHYFIIVKFQLN